MKTTTKKTRKKEAFTIIELLTVMSIIVILLGLLVPAMNKAKIYAKTVNQKNQFHSIDVALELFKTEYEDYPPSDQFDDASVAYCGAMKLAEAVVGVFVIGICLSDIATQAVDCQVHLGQLDRFQCLLLAVHVKGIGRVGFLGFSVRFHKRGRLDKHAARATSGVEDGALMRLNDLDHQAHYGARGEEFATPLPFGQGKIAQEVFVYLAEEVAVGIVGDVGEVLQ